MKRLSFLIFLILCIACNRPENKTETSFFGYWLEETGADQKFVQGLILYPDGTASSIGMETLKYEKWTVQNNRLILSGKSIGNRQTIDFSEEWLVIEISPRTMKLKTSGNYRRHYQRTEKMPDLKK